MFTHALLLLLCTFMAHANYSGANDLVLPIKLELSVAQDNQQKIQQALPDAFVLQAISYACDVYLSQAEFAYLVELHEGQTVTAQDIYKAVTYLSKKNKFDTITLTIAKGETGNKVHLDIVGLWTFKKLIFHGAMIGKEIYRQYYLLEPGSPYDDIKHARSLQAMRDAFRREGYFNAQVESNNTYDFVTKQVVTHVSLQRNERFIMDDVRLRIHADSFLEGKDASFIADVRKNFINKLAKSNYSKTNINKETVALKKYLARKGFINVDIELKEKVDYKQKIVRLVFDIEVHHKKEFLFCGNQFLSQDKLLDIILMFGRSAWLLPASILADEIKQAYHKRGFWQTDIQAVQERERYTFTIVEGPRVSVKQVIVHHAPYFDGSQLKKQLFAQLLKVKFYDVDSCKQSVDQLLMWYQKQGFADAQIIKQEFVMVDDGSDSYVLIITMEEGERRYLDSVHIEPFKELECQEPFVNWREVQPHERIPYNAHIIQEQRRWLTDHFQKKGYLYVVIKYEERQKGDSVSLTWHIQTDEKPVVFGKTILQGSSQFPFEYITRELQYKQGDIWQKQAIKSSFVHLKDLEVFESVHLYPDHIAQPEQEKSIILHLQEDDPFEIRLRGGFELQNLTQQFSTNGVACRVGGAFIYKNPFNLGDQFKIDANFARGHREFVTKYSVPWLWNLPVKTVLMGYSNKYAQPGFVGSTKNIYVATQQGMLFGLSHKHSFFDAGLNVGFEWMKTNIPDKSCHALINNVARAIDFDPRLLDRNVPFFQIEPTLIIDCVDQRINPTKGSFTVLSVKGMFPLNQRAENGSFIKGLLEQSFFIPFKSIVAAMRFRLGHIFYKKFNNIMPIERFYLGGANSLRSYDTDFAPPLGRYINDQGITCFAPQGGKTMVNVNAEIRFPVYKWFSGVVFQDIGALSSNAFADIQAKDLLFGTGFGARVATPLGPLRFDVGWKWTKPDPTCRAFAWFLTFGQAF